MTHHINFWGLGAQYKDAPAIGWLSLTFLIFVYLCIKMIKKPLSLYLETRSMDIKRQIEEAKKAESESAIKLKSYEDKIASLDTEISKMKEEFLILAQKEKEELKKMAQEQEHRILQDTDETIKANFLRLRNDLAKELIEKAIDEAKNTIEKDREALPIDNDIRKSFSQRIAV